MEPTVIDALPEEVRSTLPPEMLTDANLTKYKTIPDLLNGHVNLAKMISAKGVIVPQEGAAPEEFDKFYNSLGRPEKPDGYKMSELKDLHPSIKVSPESQKQFLDFAHKQGFTAKQADGLNQWYLKTVDGMLKAQDKAWNDKVQAADLALKNKWGAEYDKNIAAAKDLIAKKGGAEVLAGLGEAVNNPAVLEFLSGLGAAFAEDNVADVGNGKAAVGTKEEAMAKITAMNADPKHAVWNLKDPNHDSAVEERRQLYEAAFPANGGE